MNEQNLRMFTSDQSREEAAKNGRKGGIASGKSKRLRKSLRDSLKEALGCQIPKKSPLYASMKKKKQDLGWLGDVTVQDIPVLGMIMKSAKDPAAFNALRDTIGEKPVETFEDVTPRSPFEVGLVPLEMVEEAKAANEKRQMEE